MSNGYFQFKQFTVRQEYCAMKVGTDSALLGAYAPIEGSTSILDIGTGTGVIALMMAQRCSAKIVGIEIDEAAVCQAIDNVAHSPWANQIEILQGDFAVYPFLQSFNCIVSNPPFFEENLKCPEEKRNSARHVDTLSFEVLLKGVSRLLKDDGKFILILPTLAVCHFLHNAYIVGLFPSLRLTVYTLSSVPSKRTILILTKKESECREESFVIETEPHHYSESFIKLMRAYYLYF